jgi:hypothetical protein
VKIEKIEKIEIWRIVLEVYSIGSYIFARVIDSMVNAGKPWRRVILVKKPAFLSQEVRDNKVKT